MVFSKSLSGRAISAPFMYPSVIVLVVGGVVQADTEAPSIVLTPAAKDLDVGPEMNATGRDLRGCRFVGQDLRRAVFDDCNLADVHMFQCDLTHASFRRAVFTGAMVGECQLREADFTDAIVNGNGYFRGRAFYALELSPEQLVTTKSYKTKNLYRSVINGAQARPVLDLRDADLREARVIRGDFSKCDFSNAHVYGTVFENFAFTFEQLASTADFRRRHLCIQIRASEPTEGLRGHVSFKGINLEGSRFWDLPEDADFTDALVNGVNFYCGISVRQLCSTASHKMGDLSRLSLAGADLSGCDLSETNLAHSRFGRCDFSSVNLKDAVITRVDFCSVPMVPSGCSGLTVNQIKSTWNYKHGRMEGIVLPEEITEALEEE